MPGSTFRSSGRRAAGALFVSAALLALLSSTNLSAQQKTAFDAQRLFPIMSVAQSSAAAPALAGIVELDARAASFAALRREAALRLNGVPLPGGNSADLLLESFSIFDERSAVYSVGPHGQTRRPIPDITLYKGRVAGDVGSWVYLAVEAAGMSGTIIAGGTAYTVYTPALLSMAPGETPRITIAEKTGDESEYSCGVTDEDEIAQLGGLIDSAPKKLLAARDTLLAQIAIEADFEAYQHYKSLANTENYIIARMGESSAIYERDLDVTLKIPFMRVWTVKDPFPGSSDRELLNVFTNYWRDNMDTVARTLAVMISRKPISANGVSQGLAWLHVLCSRQRGTAFVKFSGSDGFITGHVGVLAHEIGHNFGSPHTHSCLWNPPVDSCYTAEPKSGQAPCFTAGEIHLLLGGGEMMSYCHMRYGGANKHNIFRQKVGSAVRQWAEEAPCMEATSLVRSLTLTGPPGGTSMCAGDSLVLTWEASGNNEFQILLSRNDGASYDSVLVDGLPRTERRWVWRIPGDFAPGTGYRLRIKDKKNETLVDQMKASVEIKKGVYIVSQVTWRNVCAGEGVTFNVTAAGSGTLRYQWRKNGTDIPGATNWEVTLQNMQPSDNLSTFTCMVYGDCGSIESKPALLRVFTMPVITKQPNNDTVCVGQRAVIRLEAEGPELTYRWYEMPGGIIHNVNMPEFIIDNVQGQKAYYCEVKSPCGSINSQTGFTIITQPGIAFMSPKSNEVLTAGGTFDLRWRAFCINDVSIEYSLDNGATWTDISLRTPAGDRVVSWQVPLTETTQGLFRISDADVGSRTTTSPVFIIRKRPQTSFVSREVNFGLVETGTTATKDVELTNSGLGALNLSSVTVYGNTDVAVVPPTLPLTVPAGTPVTLSFTWKPTQVGPLTGFVVLQHNGLPQRDTLPLVGDAFTTTAADPASPASMLHLHASYPNPMSLSASPRASVAFELPAARQAKLAVYSLLGEEIQVLMSGYTGAGRHEVAVDASRFVPGVYMLRLTAGIETRTQVMHVIR